MKVLYNDGHVDECPADEITHVIRHSAAHIMAHVPAVSPAHQLPHRGK